MYEIVIGIFEEVKIYLRKQRCVTNEILPFINRRQEFLENIFFEKLFKNC